ncbi:MAG TPA: DUF1905 domain-containing protein [Methylophilaceae bacterium]|nr:DUF1905 domain-containing protein [Methylophilaceae bacterium]HAJ70670.1 DUF1905 domain-containing protein [Methylophilaceae bacterium]
MIDLSFNFSGKCWLWQGKGAWHFITLPQDKSEEIKFFSEHHGAKRRGWGAVKVIARIGNTSWETSIFPYAKEAAYILPVKADVRKKEKIIADDVVSVSLNIHI